MSEYDSLKAGKEHRGVPSAETKATSELSAARAYLTHPERKVLRLDNLTLLEFIKDVEERDFRTEHDAGANLNALYIWNHVRRLAALPQLNLTDLRAWCVTCEKYHQYPHERKKPVTSEQKG